jgi:divalent metal cation (Fe/Co/Zn/Cd) transporter
MNDGLQARFIRQRALAHASNLEYFTIGWNVLEGVIAVLAAHAAGSVALLGFGIDSFVESASGGVLLWRLSAERVSPNHEGIEEIDRQARKLVGLSLFLLAAFVVMDSAWTLWRRERPEPSLVGIALTAVSIGVMWWLARAKRRVAHVLGSRALESDSFQTTACFWLSIFVLCGVGLNAAFGYWWADPAAALGMTWFIVREGRAAWRGEDECLGC